MLDDLSEWGKTCGLKFNPEKSVAVIFTRRRKQPPFPLRIDGKDIEFKSEVKYLGVTLDSKLHWGVHIEEKITKAKRYLSKVAYMTRNNWGPKPRLMRWAYIGIVRPMICYGAMIWGHRAPELISKFRRINRMAINTFANFPKSTPTIALEVMLDILPLHLFCVQEATAARLRLDDVLEFGWHGTSHTKLHATSHMKFLEGKLQEFNLDVRNTDRFNGLKWGEGFKINRDSFDGAAKHRQLTQLNVYTDGSKLDAQTGAGLAIYRGKQEIENAWFRLPNGTTVFQAEVAAISEAAKSLIKYCETGAKFVKIFIDSQAAIQAIGNPHVRSRTVATAIDNLNDLAKRVTSVTLVWIPAHKGHMGNERADELAKKGSKETDKEHYLDVGMPAASLRAALKERIYGEWNTEWLTAKSANHTKGFYGGPSQSKARFVYKLARLELGRFARIVTGHNNLNFFQAKLGLHHSGICRFCQTNDETITHLMAVCPVFLSYQRNILLGELPSPDMKWSVRQLLNFSYIPGINDAYEGNWASGDPPAMASDDMDVSLGLEWLDDDLDDEHDTPQ